MALRHYILATKGRGAGTTHRSIATNGVLWVLDRIVYVLGGVFVTQYADDEPILQDSDEVFILYKEPEALWLR